LEVLGVDGREISVWILEKYGGKCELDASDSGQEPVACSCKHGHELSGYVKGGGFLD
jgi:hypothetical protein